MDRSELGSTSPKSEIEAAKSDNTLIDALIFLGTLHELDLTHVETNLQKPLLKLFEYAQARMQLGGRDRDLPGKIKEFFVNQPNAPQWVTDTDLKHTVACFGYSEEITRKEGFTTQERKIVLSAIIVHDCAYPKTEDFATFTSPDTRLSHMRDGETEFRNFANEINTEFPDFYSPDEIEIVCSIVRQHDNPSVKIDGKTLQFSYNPPPQKLMWAHREGDRLWMLDRGGFALDLIRRLLESNPWYNPSKYLEHVISEHLKESGKYENNDGCISYQGEKTLYRTASGFEIFQRLVRERAEEYNINTSTSTETSI